MNFRSMLVAAALVLPTFALAEEEQKKAPPPSPLTRLQGGLGTAKGTFTLTMGDKVHKLNGDRKCVKASGGAGIQCTLSVKGVPGLPSYEETGLFGYDAEQDAIHYYTVTNAGEVHDHKGSFDGDVLRLEHTGRTACGKDIVERIAVDLSRPGEETIRTVQLLDGKETLVLEGKWVGKFRSR